MEVTLTELWANITQTKKSLALRQQKLVLSLPDPRD